MKYRLDPLSPTGLSPDEPRKKDVSGAFVSNGVDSISKAGEVQLKRNVTLSAGSNVTLTQSGQNIEIASTGGGGGGGTGDVVGPASSTDNAITRFDGLTGKLIQNSTVTVSDTGDIATSGTVDGRDVSVDGARLDVITDADYKNSNTTKAQVGLSNVDNTSDLNKPISTATQTALDTKVDENAAIVAGTKTKITYDAKGLVTAGADATTADIADSLNKRYVTDANLTTLANTSGTNTGDQTSIVGITGTKAQFDTAVTDGNILYVGDITQYTDEQAQDATGAMAANSTFVSLTYNDATPSLTPSLSATGTPSATTFLRGDNTWATPAGGGGSGDVVGPASATDNAIARYDTTTGKLIQNSTVLIDDTGNIDMPATTSITLPTAGGEEIVVSSTGITSVAQPVTVTSASTIDLNTSSSSVRLNAGTSLLTDTINETTAAAGVTVDGVLLKDGGLNGVPIATTTGTQTLTNKTLTTPVISSISNTGTLTLPTSTDTLVGRATTDTLTNKTLTDSTTLFQDDADNTKKMAFQLSGITTGTTRTLTVPNRTGTLYVTGGTDVSVADGGTGRSTSTTAYGLIAAGTTATGALQTLPAGATTAILVGGGASALPVWTTATGTGAPVREGSPALTGTPTAPTATASTNTTQIATTAMVQLAVAAAKEALFPVGAIYTATVATNPATLLGFGTWAAYGEGRVIVGKAPSGTFGTAGATGGAETHTLVTGEMPAHTHTPSNGASFIAGGAGTSANITTGGGGYVGVAATNSSGGGGAHNNLQPYIVAYVWQRTA